MTLSFPVSLTRSLNQLCGDRPLTLQEAQGLLDREGVRPAVPAERVKAARAGKAPAEGRPRNSHGSKVASLPVRFKGSKCGFSLIT